MNLISKNGYEIYYEEKIEKKTKTIVLCIHGFGSSYKGNYIQNLKNRLMKKNIGFIALDLPCHGNSNIDGKYLTVDNCIEDINSVIDYIKDKYPDSKLIVFSISFGGYLTLLYDNRYKNKIDYMILRSPAINMYNTLYKIIMTKDMKKQLKEKGYFIHNWNKEIKVTKRFIDDLMVNNLFHLYKSRKVNNLTIFHGTKDDVAPFKYSKKFTKKYGGKLIPILGANHRCKKEEQIKFVLDETINIIKKI